MKSKFTSLSLAEQDKSNTVKFFTDLKNGVTVCRLYDRWNDRYFSAKTRCHDVDVFDEKKGRAIAFNKARKKELLNDIAYLEGYQKWLTESYETAMKAADHRLGLKHIYLAGVNDELDELLNGEPEDVGEPVQFEETESVHQEDINSNESEQTTLADLYKKPEDTNEEMSKADKLPKNTNKTKIKLTQFAKFIETEG